MPKRPKQTAARHITAPLPAEHKLTEHKSTLLFCFPSMAMTPTHTFDDMNCLFIFRSNSLCCSCCRCCAASCSLLGFSAADLMPLLPLRPDRNSCSLLLTEEGPDWP